MTIAEVGKRYALTVDTLRYYERIGLIPPITRNTSGNREYSEEDCKWVHFIKCMRSAGLSIETLIEYVSMFQKGDETITTRKELLIEQRRQIAEKIEELTNTMAYLDVKIDNYDNVMLRCELELKK